MGAFTLFRTPNLWTILQLRRDLRSFLRVNFLYAAFDAGLLQALGTPASHRELCARLQVQRPELLDALLRLGVSLGELGESREQYRLKGRRALTLSKPGGDALAALLQEHVSYHGAVYLELRERLGGAALGNYLDHTGTLVARSSRVLEPYMADFVRTVIRKVSPARMFEIGCGSGIYLRYALQAKPDLTGIAIDMQPAVVEHARQNLAEWGIQFPIAVGNVLKPPPDVAGPFDLATLYNNIYYFPVKDRVALFRRIGAWLAPHGALALVSIMRARNVDSANFDVVLQSTAGCGPLPETGELSQQLQESGFSKIESGALLPGEAFYGVLAYK